MPNCLNDLKDILSQEELAKIEAKVKLIPDKYGQFLAEDNVGRSFHSQSSIFGNTPSHFENKLELEACFTWVGNVRNPIAHARPVSENDYLMFIAGARWIQLRIQRYWPKHLQETTG